jgi:TonB-dependent SusC/RagA subfamily outer membrane receptor
MNLKTLTVLFQIVTVMLLPVELFSQQKSIRGIVTTFDSIPLIGASIKVKSSKLVVLTDSIGGFSLSCLDKDLITVSAQGFYRQNVKITPEVKVAAINLNLKPGEKAREHAIGYGHVSDKQKLNAVASINKNDMDFSQYRDIYEIIQGRFSGVQISGNDIIIRGINSINSSSAALIIVDGNPTDANALRAIPPIQVKSINVIKDGSAAIYGSRGANGVVIIETRRGND